MLEKKCSKCGEELGKHSDESCFQDDSLKRRAEEAVTIDESPSDDLVSSQPIPLADPDTYNKVIEEERAVNRKLREENDDLRDRVGKHATNLKTETGLRKYAEKMWNAEFAKTEKEEKRANRNGNLALILFAVSALGLVLLGVYADAVADQANYFKKKLYPILKAPRDSAAELIKDFQTGSVYTYFDINKIHEGEVIENYRHDFVRHVVGIRSAVTKKVEYFMVFDRQAKTLIVGDRHTIKKKKEPLKSPTSLLVPDLGSGIIH